MAEERNFKYNKNGSYSKKKNLTSTNIIRLEQVNLYRLLPWMDSK